MSFISLRPMMYMVVLCFAHQGCQTPSVAVDAGSSIAKSQENTSVSATAPSKWLPMLTQQPAAWRGTPYLLGGTDKSGIDCSGFVHMTYKKHLGKVIPRSTKLLATYGHKIDPSNARAGDLVFFNTTDTVDHVGIYVSETEFVHASTSRGVILSKFSNPYWKPRYWQTRRIEL